MPTPAARRLPPPVVLRRFTALLVTALIVVATMSNAEAGPGLAAPTPPSGPRTVSYHGYQVTVPSRWQVVDLAARPHSCVRFDRPAVYLGHPGDQRACPPHLVGGAPGLLVEPLDARSAPEVTRSTVAASRGGAVRGAQLPQSGPVTIAVEGAGVLVTAVYGTASAQAVQHALARGHLLATAHPRMVSSLAPAPASTAPAAGLNAPGDYVGAGFDACTAPSQAAMDAWQRSSAYSAVGVYIGGVSRGCAQPNLTASWVSQQARAGWHFIPTYVGLQAPCRNFYNRMSYDPATARAQGRAESRDAAAQASALGMAAPSTLYSDIEAYDNTNAGCVAAVLSYVSGWTRGLHAQGYQAGVYSSASSGIRDLSTSYGSTTYNRPDDIWLAWWNYAADVAGGSYVPDTQWSVHQRIHQYVGSSTETYGGYTIQIDRDFLDVSSAVAPPRGCPTNLNFTAYPVLRRGDTGGQARAAQCQLARRGFDPGAATGTVGWRTAAAVKAFNASRSLRSTAVVGRRTWTALLSGGTTPLLEPGATGRPVKKLQRSLSASLVRTVAVDGAFDRETRRAVVEYQQARGLPVTGSAGSRTWRALQAGL